MTDLVQPEIDVHRCRFIGERCKAGSSDRRSQVGQVLMSGSEIDEAILFADNLIVLRRSPGKVRAEISVDLGRPRSLEMLTQRRYAELKYEALGILYEEAVGAFASGVRSASDIVEAYQKREIEYPVDFAIEMIAAVIASSSGSSGMSRTKERSILTASTGNRFR